MFNQRNPERKNSTTRNNISPISRFHFSWLWLVKCLGLFECATPKLSNQIQLKVAVLWAAMISILPCPLIIQRGRRKRVHFIRISFYRGKHENEFFPIPPTSKYSLPIHTDRSVGVALLQRWRRLNWLEETRSAQI